MFVLGGCLRWIAVLRLFDVVLVAGVLLCWGMFVDCQYCSGSWLICLFG